METMHMAIRTMPYTLETVLTSVPTLKEALTFEASWSLLIDLIGITLFVLIATWMARKHVRAFAEIVDAYNPTTQYDAGYEHGRETGRIEGWNQGFTEGHEHEKETQARTTRATLENKDEQCPMCEYQRGTNPNCSLCNTNRLSCMEEQPKTCDQCGYTEGTNDNCSLCNPNCKHCIG